jgi:hypothetical protein
MKKISLLCAIFLLLVISIPVNSKAQNTHTKLTLFPEKIKNVKHTAAFQSQHRGNMYPHQAILYLWDEMSSAWELFQAEKYIYYPDGTNMFTYTLEKDFSDTTTKETNLYDDNGFNTYYSREEKIGPGNWQMLWGSRSTITYYAPSKLEMKTEEDWDQIINDWRSSYKTIYTHNGSGLLTNYIEQEWDTSKSSWVNSSKYEFLYDGNNKNNEMNLYIWDKNTWLQDEKLMISWHIFNPYQIDEIDIDSAEGQMWDTVSQQFVKDMKVKLTRDANGGYIETFYVWDNSWTPNERSSEKYDASKNYTGSVQEVWNGTGWDTVYVNEYVLTYVSGNVTEKINRTWQQGDPAGLFTNRVKYVYSEFNSLKENLKIQLNAYPQPFKNDLIVEIPEILNQNTVLQITDLNGKTMISQKLPNSTQHTKIDVSALSAGLYILSLQTTKGKVSKLVIKQ